MIEVNVHYEAGVFYTGVHVPVIFRCYIAVYRCHSGVIYYVRAYLYVMTSCFHVCCSIVIL